MLLPTMRTGVKWSWRQTWDMLMSPVSPRNLRTTALLTSIYQLVSLEINANTLLLCLLSLSLFHSYIMHLIMWGTAYGLPARRELRYPAVPNVQLPMPLTQKLRTGYAKPYPTMRVCTHRRRQFDARPRPRRA